jgi:hypothetical protein
MLPAQGNLIVAWLIRSLHHTDRPPSTMMFWPVT